ncbi:MAG: hypothetical protein HC929_23550 [Leptolyngbyaceae cyanobacterium SM2_5_2]|nr:hypothetical protein [Leptolyngbyaceae cyanobacterium SM2_5_2]
MPAASTTTPKPLASALLAAGFTLWQEPVFDTLRVTVGDRQAAILSRAAAHRINLRVLDAETLAIALDETVTAADLDDLLEVFTGEKAEGRRQKAESPNSKLQNPPHPHHSTTPPTAAYLPTSPTPPLTATTRKRSCCVICIACKTRISPWRQR